MKQMDVLDGIRGYAIITVMLYHFTQQLQHMSAEMLSAPAWFMARLFEGMWLGVDLFFVMSGFLITCILLSTAGQPGYFKNFYLRRVLRIFPLYYAVLLALMVIAPMLSSAMAEQTAVIRENAFWFLTYTINWRIAYLGDFREISAGYMWSLAVEEQFYLLWPLIVYKFRRSLSTVCFSLVAVSLLSKIALHQAGLLGPSLYAATLTHMDGLLLGAGFAAVYRQHGDQVPVWFADAFRRMAWVCAIGMVALVLQNGHLAFYEDLNPVVGVTAFSVIFLSLLITTLRRQPDSLWHRALTLRPVMFCGKLCYGLYLLHHPIGVVVEKVLGGTFTNPLYSAYLVSGVALLLSVQVAYLSFHLFEKHFLGLKRHFEQKAPDVVAPADDAVAIEGSRKVA